MNARVAPPRTSYGHALLALLGVATPQICVKHILSCQCLAIIFTLSLDIKDEALSDWHD
jgi:hypothetical protein